MKNPRLFAVAAFGSNSEKAGAGIIKSSIPRHNSPRCEAGCRGNGKTLTFWADSK